MCLGLYVAEMCVCMVDTLPEQLLVLVPVTMHDGAVSPPPTHLKSPFCSVSFPSVFDIIRENEQLQPLPLPVCLALFPQSISYEEAYLCASCLPKDSVARVW